MVDLALLLMQPWLAACLAASLALYAIGIARLWRRAGVGRGIATWQAALFTTGWVTLALALCDPVDEWTELRFWSHMIQHELLMVVAAPLFVLGRPLEAWSWALPAAIPQAIRGIFRVGGIGATWALLTEPLGAWCVHALAIWAWHVPALFEMALRDENVHILQHACFLASALAFWWAVADRRREERGGVAMAMVFTTMMHTSALGALLALASSPWYPSYAAGSATLTGLEDQQLGGLVMWLPGSVAYVLAGLLTAYRWLSPPRRTADSRAATSRSSC
jgi:putative membrane protein